MTCWSLTQRQAPLAAMVQRVRQLMWSLDSSPGRLSPSEPFGSTVTWSRVPLAASTTTPRSGRTPVAPSLGVMTRRGAAGETLPEPAEAGTALAFVCDACPTSVPDAVNSSADPSSASTLPARLNSRTPALNRTLDLQGAARPCRDANAETERRRHTGRVSQPTRDRGRDRASAEGPPTRA